MRYNFNVYIIKRLCFTKNLIIKLTTHISLVKLTLDQKWEIIECINISQDNILTRWSSLLSIESMNSTEYFHNSRFH